MRRERPYYKTVNVEVAAGLASTHTRRTFFIAVVSVSKIWKEPLNPSMFPLGPGYAGCKANYQSS